MITCRFCKQILKHIFLALGPTPIANAYLKKEDLHKMEPFYPLDVYVCENCFLVQLPEFENPENIFSDYAYFSSFSDTWLQHARDYANSISTECQLNSSSLVIEIASNDGYLLQYFLEKRVPVLGIEPAKNVAQAAVKKGIPTETVFFGTEIAKQFAEKGKKADLLIGNNVLAHVPDLNDFVQGLKIILKTRGVLTLEFPHLMRLVENAQFDTIYHEHFSYFSFFASARVLSSHGLTVFKVEELPTHGGSLRVYAKHSEDATKEISQSVSILEKLEKNEGYDRLETYFTLAPRVQSLKWELLSMLSELKTLGKTIAGYGAPAKGNTLLNYCGIKTDFIDYTVDKNPHKQGRFLPGSHIPVEHPNKLRETKPDFLFILPWNIKDEVMAQTSFIREWGGQFIVPIPKVKVL